MIRKSIVCWWFHLEYKQLISLNSLKSVRSGTWRQSTSIKIFQAGDMSLPVTYFNVICLKSSAKAIDLHRFYVFLLNFYYSSPYSGVALFICWVWTGTNLQIFFSILHNVKQSSIFYLSKSDLKLKLFLIDSFQATVLIRVYSSPTCLV